MPCQVAFLGPKGSFTHQAALKRFGDGDGAELVSEPSIQDAFTAVQDQDTEFSVVPFENSSNGSVVFTLDLFVDKARRSPDVMVVDEVYLPVSHCLVGKPGVRPEDIKKVYSHPQAWGQCKQYLNGVLKTAEKQDVSSTSRAAELVATESGEGSAAISSRLAAGLNGLEIIKEGIEDSKENTTRFFVLRRRADSKTDTAESPKYGAYKTMISLTVDHAAPGALADALAVFKQSGVNLTSINSRPSGQGNWNYVFFIEFAGHKDHEGVSLAMQRLDKIVKEWRWLGSWRDAST